jgi:hypothetical protein
VKTCKVCGIAKPLDEFYANKGGRDGRRPECKSCHLAARKARYDANPRVYIERVLKWQRENRDRYLAKQREYKESGRKAISDRKSHLKRKYGLTIEEFDAMLAAQGGGCAICGYPDADNVDHDHATGRVRGILCWNCNVGVGQFEDSEDRLAAAMAYVTRDEELAAVARERLVALSA